MTALRLARRSTRRALLTLLGALLLTGAAWAGTYLNSAALLLSQSSKEGDYLRAHIGDKELADLIHKLANARLEAAKGMLVPKEVVQAHPHLLLVLENYERAADSATRGEAEKFLVYQQRARDEDRTFRGVLKQFGYALPEPKP
ncbi:MAG TPA: hypothetical protein VGC79_05150 [Polyangiaceae bacterium]